MDAGFGFERDGLPLERSVVWKRGRIDRSVICFIVVCLLVPATECVLLMSFGMASEVELKGINKKTA